MSAWLNLEVQATDARRIRPTQSGSDFIQTSTSEWTIASTCATSYGCNPIIAGRASGSFKPAFWLERGKLAAANSFLVVRDF